MTIPSANYDVLLIGAGQIGDPLGRALARAGNKTLVIERDQPGGTCTNRGCTPTKTLAASARIAHLVRRAADFGVLVGGEVTVDFERVLDRKDALVADFRDETHEGLENTPNLDFVFGEARFVGPRTLLVTGRDGTAQRTQAGRIVLNVGARPAVPPVTGLNAVPFLDSTTILDMDRLPSHLLILGGGYIGLEFGQMFRRFGSRVTLIEAGAQLLADDEDADVTGAMADLLRAEGVDVRLGTKAEHAEASADGEVRLTVRPKNGSPETLTGSHLLVATGRAPNTDNLGLVAAGIVLDKNGFICVNERLETSAPGVWAGGEAAGSPGFTHIAYDDFRVLRDQLLGTGARTTTDRLVPQTVFTDPQLGRVGLSEKQARAAGHTIRVARVAAHDLARPRETGESEGFIKAVVDADTQQILGFAAFCREGGELMGAVTVALMARLPYPVLRDGIFSHPTLVESLNNLFLALDAPGNTR